MGTTWQSENGVYHPDSSTRPSRIIRGGAAFLAFGRPFLGRLKNEFYRTRYVILHPGKDFRRPHQNRRMAVVPAGRASPPCFGMRREDLWPPLREGRPYPRAAPTTGESAWPRRMPVTPVWGDTGGHPPGRDLSDARPLAGLSEIPRFAELGVLVKVMPPCDDLRFHGQGQSIDPCRAVFPLQMS